MLWKLCKEGNLTCDPHNWKSFFSFRLLPSPFAKYLGKNDPQILSSIFMFCGFHVLAHAIKALSKLYLPTTPKANTFVINLISQILLNHKESSEDKTDCHCLGVENKLNNVCCNSCRQKSQLKNDAPESGARLAPKNSPSKCNTRLQLQKAGAHNDKIKAAAQMHQCTEIALNSGNKFILNPICRNKNKGGKIVPKIKIKCKCSYLLE